MAVVVLGAAGWIGNSIMERLPEAVPITAREQWHAGADDIVINAAGRRGGSDQQIHEANLAPLDKALESAGWVVQLGSAAEYGLDVPSPVTEETACHPSSNYGRTKLLATERAFASGTATVLRLFNLVDNPPQPGTPIADIWSRIQRGVDSGTPIEVLSGDTVRDYVSRQFVVDAILWAAEHRPRGVFNIASGIPSSVRDIAAAAASQMDSDVGVRDLRELPATTIWSNPSRWRQVSGMCQHLGPVQTAACLTSSARRAVA